MSMHWKIKGLVQKVLSGVPGGTLANDRLQLLGGLRHFDRNIASKVKDWTLTCKYLSDVKFSIAGASMVEVGTGWHPVLPICIRLAGARSIRTYDIHRHLNPKWTRRASQSGESGADLRLIRCENAKLTGRKQIVQRLGENPGMDFGP